LTASISEPQWARTQISGLSVDGTLNYKLKIGGTGRESNRRITREKEMFWRAQGTIRALCLQLVADPEFPFTAEAAVPVTFCLSSNYLPFNPE
jgi:hypothetical protein